MHCGVPSVGHETLCDVCAAGCVPRSARQAGRQGANSKPTISRNSAYVEISSYAVMDSLISHILLTFPNTQEIVLVGNSAGGQYVNRYAAGSDQEGEGKIHYIISAPSSYIYFDEALK